MPHWSLVHLHCTSGGNQAQLQWEPPCSSQRCKAVTGCWHALKSHPDKELRAQQESTSQAGKMLKSEFEGGQKHPPHIPALPTCPSIRHVVLDLQEHEEGGHGERHVALAAQAHVVVAWGREKRELSWQHPVPPCLPAPAAQGPLYRKAW